ncbi:hypothetical protein [Cohnella fermenti]|uniref:DUF3153 domain-containing protein n=1 Tax=Cohnella fermenti TaxID=2565925 RepID=A0A4S4C6J3_9BACL|nr:hypothetical protein [Cohnella fermenti]THF83508.1 hypothetical protein E6C55_04940 [Cohnella fermenti]
MKKFREQENRRSGRGWKRRALLTALLLACTVALTSCVKGEAHLTINMNATADLALNLAVSNKALDLIGRPELLQELAGRIAGDRMTFQSYEKDGQHVLEGTRHLDLKEMKSEPIDLPEGIEVEHRSVQHFLYTTYEVELTVDTDKLMGGAGSGGSAAESGEGEGKAETDEGAGEDDAGSLADKLSSLSPLVKKLVLSQLDFDLKVTFPLKPGANNAPRTEEGGRTLVWPFSFSEPNRFELSLSVPNIRNVLLVGVPVLFVAIGGGTALIVRARKRRRSGK